MRYSVLAIGLTMDFLARRRPFLEQVFKIFKPLLVARQALVKELAQSFQAANISLPRFQPGLSAGGSYLLAGKNLDFLKPCIPDAAKKLLPLLYDLQTLQGHREALSKLFLQDVAKPIKLFEALLAEDEQSILAMAQEFGLPPEVLIFAGEFLLSALLRPLVKLATPEDGDFPWDEEGAWSQGYCPVCGNFPGIAWLDRSNLGEKNAFLVGGGGKKNFYCSLCGASWKFRRGVCPTCGKEGDGIMEILQEAGANGERIDYCVQCKHYCPTVDLREFGDVPDMDVMAIGMLHMDIVASRKNLQPLKPAFWNSF